VVHWKAIDYDPETGEYYRRGGFLALGEKFDKTHSLDLYILNWTKDYRLVTIWGYKDDFPSMEGLIEQWNEYGINEWWKIKW